MTWGDAKCGGDSSAVRDQLKGVQQIQATDRAFAAILEDGSVVTWGHARRGGDCSAVRDQLKGVQQIQATSLAFAAILADGSVVTWGHAGFGGDSSAVRDQLEGGLVQLRVFAGCLAEKCQVVCLESRVERRTNAGAASGHIWHRFAVVVLMKLSFTQTKFHQIYKTYR